MFWDLLYDVLDLIWWKSTKYFILSWLQYGRKGFNSGSGHSVCALFCSYIHAHLMLNRLTIELSRFDLFLVNFLMVLFTSSFWIERFAFVYISFRLSTSNFLIRNTAFDMTAHTSSELNFIFTVYWWGNFDRTPTGGATIAKSTQQQSFIWF